MNLLQEISKSILAHQDSTAFCINGVKYTYKDFAKSISSIRQVIQLQIDTSQKNIGLVTNDDLETYASIIALWLEGKAYIPVNPDTPTDRNLQIFAETETQYIIDSSEKSIYTETFTVITSTILPEVITIDLSFEKPNTNDLAYILFTSGTTGVPKGVPITFANVNGLSEAVKSEPSFNLTSEDRCLQMFELTFDFSVVAYLFPILSGSCIYTIPKNTIKYFYIYKLIVKEKLTVLTMVPSIINYLRPYFSEINALNVRYCSFGGGALHSDIAKEWSECLPNCKIFNYYGPTEFTVYSGFYPYNKDTHTKSHNGIIAIGTPQKGTTYLLVDKNNEEVSIGKVGELCLAGVQITPGYWKNPIKNKTSFFTKSLEGKEERLYKTGDLCIKDQEGDFLYVARADFQVKIRGYRVELSEVEYHAKAESLEKVNIVALDILNNLGNTELALAIEGAPFNTQKMFSYMKAKMPDYMIPTHFKFIEKFPHNINGKIDREKLRTHFK